MDDYHSKGKEYFDKGEYDKAIDYFEKAIKAKDNVMWAWFDKGKALIELGRFEPALDALEEAKKLDDKNTWVFSQLGVAYARLGEYVKARKYLMEAMKLDENNEEAIAILRTDAEEHLNNGKKLADRGKHKEALKHFDYALVVDSGKYWAMFDKAKSLIELGRPNEAETLLKKVRKFTDGTPEGTWIYSQLAKIAAVKGKYQKAHDYCKKALELDKNNQEVEEVLDMLSPKISELTVEDFHPGTLQASMTLKIISPTPAATKVLKYFQLNEILEKVLSCTVVREGKGVVKAQDTLKKGVDYAIFSPPIFGGFQVHGDILELPLMFMIEYPIKGKLKVKIKSDMPTVVWGFAETELVMSE